MTMPSNQDPSIEPHLGFLENLTGGSIAMVPPFTFEAFPATEPDSCLAQFYQSLHESRCGDAPGTAPDLDLPAALWGGLVVHWACWAILDRGQANVSLPDLLKSDRASPSSPSAHWSVDLMMAVWPDVDARCKRISENDPLKETIEELAVRWPLSAIGIRLDNETIESTIIPSTAWKTVTGHPSLRRIAMDRAERSHQNELLDSLTTATR